MTAVNSQYKFIPWNSTNNEDSKKTSKQSDKNVLGKDDFLKLMITQLRYQNPLEPVNDKEFIAQMANFSELEQMKNLNTSFEKLSNQLGSYIEWQKASSAVGRKVAYISSEESESEQVLVGVVDSVVIKEGKLYYNISGELVEVDSVVEFGRFENEESDILKSILGKLEDILEASTSEEGEVNE
ncbi:flagellar hook capping FlgD N-terminal domain-containing protein [Thermosyntropha sp.]|uniref:flagellar hook capping FlgD N-terminal domain-containing protein n=1 Tax=Thermosyntropha sp. TaxID=2740820 RepID=UPI0025E58442|nr:flagellar hook capping FlgD N-terminal domain-containing protein [Thermosyntropha sp.]MBO8159353.1 flagellar hook capping protein [Thermosyntropha sp.]